MKIVFGTPLFETGEVVSMTNIHPQTLRNLMQRDPSWHRIIGGRHYWTKAGLREAFSLTDEEVENFACQCKAGTIKTGVAA